MLYSCSSPPLKNQDQLDKERISKNHIKVQRMYSLEYIDGKPIDSTAKLISEFYYDPKGNQKCVYNCENNQHELRKICEYDKIDNKVVEIWLGMTDLFKWKYYKLIYTYDSLNRLESMRLYNTIGALYFGHIYNYDIKSRLICDIQVDENFNATWADSLLYNYDSRDAYLKRSYSLGDSGEVNLNLYVSYKFDKNRHLIEEKWFDSENELKSFTTSYYNSDGLLEKSIAWDDNTKQPKTEYKYEYVRYITSN